MAEQPITIRLAASNVYVVAAGGGYVAIDAGPDYEGAWESAEAQLAASELMPGNIGSVLVTHAHGDHCALASAWQRAGAAVWIAAEDAARLRAGGRDPEPARRPALDFLEASGVPAELVAAAQARPSRRDEGDRPIRMGRRGEDGGRLGNLRSIAAEHGEWPGPLRPTPAEPDQLFPDDGRLELGSLRLHVIRCPGHTPGSVIFLDEAAGDLYTGDHVLERIAPTPGIHFDEHGGRIQSLPQYLRSLQAIRSLAVRRVLPGHGEPFADLAGAVDRTMRIFEQRANRLLRRLRAGPASAWELALRLYPHLPSSAAWVVLAEITGLLDLLEERGQVRALSGEAVFYEAG